MASPKKKWLRAKLAEQEVQKAEVGIQPEPVVEEVAPEPILVSKPTRSAKSPRRRKKKE